MSINNINNHLFQNQTIVNLYESGIPPDVIASQDNKTQWMSWIHSQTDRRTSKERKSQLWMHP